MTQKAAIFLFFIFSSATFASATEIIAYCRGSYNQDMTAQQPVEIVVEQGLLWLRPTMSSCHPATCMNLNISRANIQSTQNKFSAIEIRRRLRLTTFKKTLTIDFRSGNGLATTFIPFEDGPRTKKIYLQACERE